MLYFYKILKNSLFLPHKKSAPSLPMLTISGLFYVAGRPPNRALTPPSFCRNFYSLSFGATKVVTLLFLPKNYDAFFSPFFPLETLLPQYEVFTFFST